MAWAEKYEAEKALKLTGSYTKADAIKAYRTHVRNCHPDLGGDHDEMIAVNKAKGFMDRLFKDEPENRSFTCEAEREQKKEEKKAVPAEEYVAKPIYPDHNPPRRPEPEEAWPEEAWWEKNAKKEAVSDPVWEEAFAEYCSEFINSSESETTTIDNDQNDFDAQHGTTYSAASHKAPETNTSASAKMRMDIDDAIRSAYADVYDPKGSLIYRFADFMVDGIPWKGLFAIVCLAYALFYPLDLENYANCWAHVLSVVAAIINCMFGIFTGILTLPFRLLRMITRRAS